MKYKAVGFDWGGVLNGTPSKAFDEKIAAFLGIPVQTYLDAYFAHNKEWNRNEITRRQLWERVAADLNSTDKVEQLYVFGSEGGKQNPNKEVISIVDVLRRQGYKVGMLSNNTTEKGTELRQEGLDRHFDVFHISGDTGYVKPEPEAFHHLAKQLDVEMSELVFIDDSEKSLSSASKCGFTPIRFESAEQLTAKLAELGITV